MSDETTPESEPVIPEAAVELPVMDISAPPEVVEHRLGQFGVHGSPDVSGYGTAKPTAKAAPKRPQVRR